MDAIILKCKGNEQFRFGNGSKDEVSVLLHSDTLFSSIVTIYDLLFDNTDELIESFNTGKIKISSAFPVLENVRNGQYIYFLPKPDVEYLNSGKDNKNIKKEKKIKFVSKEVFKLISNTIKTENDVIKAEINLFDGNKFKIIDDKFCFLKDEIDFDTKEYTPYSEKTTPKVFVNTDKKEDTFYHETNISLRRLEINDELIILPHYYFLIEKGDITESLMQNILTAIRVLCDEGIGGERSCGKGNFLNAEEISLDIEANNANYYLTLSLFNPKTNDEFSGSIIYDIGKRGGGSIGDEKKADYHRKQVNMIMEGAILKTKSEGRIINVTPELNIAKHKIFRYGIPFLIPFGK